MLPAGLDAALAPGTVIGGKYRVERPLGTGGMGVVVAARHLELNQHLAIKVLLPSASKSNEATTRFLREGRSAAQLTSPHVAKVHDTGRLPSGAPYLVMELLHGRDLRALLAEVGRVPLAQAIEWCLQAAHALAEAHRLKIIHRDVKPANLFLAETSAGPLIKVLDFGVSKQLDSTEGDLTSTSSAVGTPRYMAPEQMRSARLADARGDVWSLGIVLYELTTGQSPFHGDSVTALCFDVMERTPIPPGQLNPDLPPAFDAIVARCLEKDPDTRFQSMEALAAALGTIAPGARSSGLFNAAALQSAGSVAGSTPLPAVLTPNLSGQTEPLVHPPFAELPHQETMRSWNTPAPRSGGKKPKRMPLVALGIGIGLAVAFLVGMFLNGPEPGSSAERPEAAPSSTPPQPTAPPTPPPVPETTATAEAVVAPVEPPPPSSAPSSAASAAPKIKTPSCNPRTYTDKKGYSRVKPGCE
ncbi:MAG: serine/threonine protein kinase [Polyangiaceae bacterium]|nr:serine/threonine protein kinase [Polyangiaceae bacterium]